MSYVDSLIAARDNMAAMLAEITLKPKPSYVLGDQKVDWQQYQAHLIDRMETLTRLIAQGDPVEEIGIGL